MNSDEKLKICRTCAKIVSHKRSCWNIPIEELQNIGFVNIKSDITNKAYSEAYYSMLQFASRPRFNRNDPINQRYFLGTRRAMGRCRTLCDLDLSYTIDIHDAISKLTANEKVIAILYFIHGYTQKDLCAVLNISQPSISIKIRRVKERLCYMLKEYCYER